MPATPTLVEAGAVMVTMPVTVVPERGEVMLTVGGFTLLLLATATLTGLEALWPPDLLKATAVRMCRPFLVLVVFHETEYGAFMTWAPRFKPSSWNCTPARPLLDGTAATTMMEPETLLPDAGKAIATSGAALPPFPTGGWFEGPGTPAAMPAPELAGRFSFCFRFCSPVSEIWYIWKAVVPFTRPPLPISMS